MRSHSCNEMHTIKLEVHELEGLQDYVDAQSGGPGRGWFRLVYNARQARRVIEQGKLAVVIGVESSDPFNCSEPAGCRRSDVDRGLRKLRRLGVRTLFIAHWVDNAFAGAALEGGTKGVFINIFNQVETGHYFNTGPCPDPSQGEEVNTIGPVETQILGQFFPAAAGIPPMPDYPEGKQCNSQGPDEARRLSGQADDEDRDADRGRPHERAGPRPGPRDHRPPPLSRDLGPHRHRRRLDAEGAPHALPQRRPRARRPPTRRRSSRARSSPSVSTRARSTTSGSAWAPTPAASPRCPAPATTRPRIRSPTRSSPTTARSPSPASTPATATSTSTPTGSPTTACSPTSSRTCSAARTARRPCARSSARPRPTCRCGRWRGRGADRAQAAAISSAARSPDATAPSRKPWLESAVCSPAKWIAPSGLPT